ncbi:MAG: prepilin-type N-terminal cleavage/methylation domain-containing protein [Candidatus Omnitrophota bacterium]|nr:prepilin-type N-terminal cleavage/methylation domain-containing protein [Candidatus Omnitrophota bacterium]
MMRRNRKGFTLVEIMIVVAIIALLAAIAIPNLMSAKRTANTAAAKANIRALSTAAEVYATGHNGNYPGDEASLRPYIAASQVLCGATQPQQGYTYTCTLAAAAYTITAVKASATTGDIDYSVTNGGVITES